MPLNRLLRTALIGTLIGVAASYPIVTVVFEAEWQMPWQAAALVVGGAIAVSAFGGAAAGLAALAPKPAEVLRTP